MKIAVGKTYKNGRDDQIFIECQIKHAFLNRPAGSFVGTNIAQPNASGELYNEAGQCISTAGRVLDLPYTHLVPNVVEKTGYIRVYPHGTPGSTIYPTEHAAEVSQLAVPFVVAKMTWKEEE